MLRWILEVMPGLARLRVLVPAALTMALAVGLCLLAASPLRNPVGGFMFGLILVFTVFMGAIGLMTYGFAVIWLLAGEVCAPYDAAPEFKTKQWLALVVLTFGPACGLLAIARAFVGS
jgi:hypothetical protein